MSNKFYSEEQLYKLKEEFKGFLEKKGIKSIKQYISDYEFFTNNYVLNKVLIDDFDVNVNSKMYNF